MGDFKLAIYANSSEALDRARALNRVWPGARLFVAEQLADEAAGEEAFSLKQSALALNWRHFAGHLVFGDAAAVVTAIAPLVAQQDRIDLPNVVLVDDEGRHVVSLVENPQGAAYGLAERAARELGGHLVLTSHNTADDLPHLEDLVEHYGLKLQNLGALARVKQALNRGKVLPIFDPDERLWPFLKFWSPPFKLLRRRPGAKLERIPLIWVDHEVLEYDSPNWVIVRPRCLAIGVDCRKPMPGAELVTTMVQLLQVNNLAAASISCLAASDENRDVFGLKAAAKRMGVPLKFFHADQLRHVVLPRQRRTILPGSRRSRVCEAAAVAAAGGGTLLLSKDSGRGLHLSVALEAGNSLMPSRQAIAQ